MMKGQWKLTAKEERYSTTIRSCTHGSIKCIIYNILRSVFILNYLTQRTIDFQGYLCPNLKITIMEDIRMTSNNDECPIGHMSKSLEGGQ